MPPSSQIRILKLQDKEHKQGELFRLEKGWTLRFVLGPTLMGHKVRLFTNLPSEKEKSFSRPEFYELAWNPGSKNKEDDMDMFAEILCSRAGAFDYFFLCDNEDPKLQSGSGFFQVAPTLTIGADNTVLPLDCIQACTHISKLMGPLPQWEDRLRVAKESGYNVIHFTPVQPLGESKSAYSIAAQLELNPAFNDGANQYQISDLNKLTTKMRKEWGVLSVCDVVWNHTSACTKWIQEHTDAAYNLVNSPHLRPAYILDRILWQFGRDVSDGKYEQRGIPNHITNEHHLEAVRAALRDQVFPQAALHEFFQADVHKIGELFANQMDALGQAQKAEGSPSELVLVQDNTYHRFGCTVDLKLALKIFNVPKEGCRNEIERRGKSLMDFKHALNELNNKAAADCWDHLCAAVNAIIGHITYERVAHHGPKLTEYCKTHPLLPKYFTHPFADTNWEREQDLVFTAQSANIMAYNGWVMNDDPLKNFAEPPSMVYFRRELIVWGDCIKLRYGEKAEDSPYLWEHMRLYTQLTAEVFHGIRLDNCHSTPLHVAQYLLDEARKTSPELYVVAELFTGSEHLDNIFVNNLGISSLIREAQSAPDPHEEGRLVYRYGGEPVGAFIQRSMRFIGPTIAHALFLDLTHDNPCPVQTRTVYDLMPTAALVSMACCAVGSNRGYDEMLAYHIHVVNEHRLYSSWSKENEADPAQGQVNAAWGIIAARAVLNDLHNEMGAQGFKQVFVDQIESDVVAVTRHNPSSHQSVILVARACFSPDDVHSIKHIAPLKIEGKIEEVVLEARLERKGDWPESAVGRPKALSHKKRCNGHESYLLGPNGYRLAIRKNFKSDMVEADVDVAGIQTDVDFSNFPPGSVIALRVSMRQQSKNAIVMLRRGLTQFGFSMRTTSGKGIAMIQEKGLRGILSNMSLVDLNRALFRCHEEEADEGKGGGAFDVPNFGRFVYCGFQGVYPILNAIRLNNDLGHPICSNIRFGDWLANYYADRLLDHANTKPLGQWLKEVVAPFCDVPHYLKPCYFDALFYGICNHVRDAALDNMSPFVQNGSNFVKALAIASVAFCGQSASAPLPPLSSQLRDPQPPTIVDTNTGKRVQACTTISAGLPHFACGIFRNWGRDTFIALPGCMLIPGRFEEARCIILAYAGTLRHGLIPNLLGGGTHARYNCRDAVWWWLEAIKQYCLQAPNGYSILKDKVRRLYPSDDVIAGHDDKDEDLQETMQEAIQRHVDGIKYRERNAGRGIDEHMNDEGFNVTACIDPQTGFVTGGNEWNCGTWMDKMGSSSKAGNKGKPSTPRNGAAVELQGLCASVLQFLHDASAKKLYDYEGVKRGSNSETWSDWRKKLCENFESTFYVSENVNELPADLTDARMINKCGIIRDSVKADPVWADFQLRPNFPIALALAPDILSAEKAHKALQMADKTLRGPLGMKTLDPDDMQYNGYYNNADDSHDCRIAAGANYHQGPEWVWIMGYFLRAKVLISKRLDKTKPGIFKQTVREVKQVLSKHWEHILNSSWRSLPELTNKDGAECAGSCHAQAWSVGCILEVLYQLQNVT